MDGKHEQLVVKDGDVDQALLVLWLCSRLNRGEGRLAVFLGIVKDRIHDIVPASHLNGFKEALLLAHVLENVRLQVAVDDVDCATGHIFEGLLKRLQNLLYRFKGRFTGDHLLYVLVYHLYLLNINLLGAMIAKSTEGSH